jgi:hypothetical protein
MLIDGINLLEGSTLVNLTVDSGSTLPSSPSTGELFYKLPDKKLYVYDGTSWLEAISLPIGSEVSLKQLEQNSQSASYTLVLSDSGKHILHPSADTSSRTYTIPSNSSVPFPIGTAVTFVNQNGAGTITIAINSDTMRLAGAGTTGNRTLAPNGIATALKITSTEWIISGTGLT